MLPQNTAFPDGDYFFSVFLGSKFHNFLRDSKIFPKLDVYASRIDLICNFNLLNTYIFPQHHEYQLRSDFRRLGGTFLAGVKSDIFPFSKANFGSAQKIVA